LPALALDGGTLRAGTRTASIAPVPSGSGALPLEQPSIGSRALEFAMPSDADELRVDLAIPLRDGGTPALLPANAVAAHAALDRRPRDASALGRARLETPRLPRAAAAHDPARPASATMGYTRVNRHGPALQPGSRNYERSWIRDGALTSAMLLPFGHPEP